MSFKALKNLWSGPFLKITKLQSFMHQSIPSTNIPPGQPPGIFPNFQPGSRDLYHLNFPGVPRGSNLLHNVKVPSCQLMPHEGTFQLQTDVPSLCCSLVTKSVWKLGENFKTLSMVLKLKLKDMTWTAFQFFLRFDFCKIPKFRRRPTGKAD